MREVRWHRIGEFGTANDAGELFSMQVTELIKKSGIHRVVEREQIVATLEELNIGTTSLADENMRLRLWMAISNHGFTMRRYPILDEFIIWECLNTGCAYKADIKKCFKHDFRTPV